MPTSILYHTNQISNVQEENIEFFNDKIVFYGTYRQETTLCPRCNHNENTLKGEKTRKLRLAPLGNKAAFLSLRLYRMKCKKCNHIWWPRIPFVHGKRRVTHSFESYVLNLMNFATIEHVAKFLGVSWGLIKDIHKAHLKREYKEVDLNVLTYVGVDEFSIRKGHDYMTIFINLETGEIIHAVEGKSLDCVTPFMLQLKEKATTLKAIAMDMNAAYASAVKKYLPNVDIVFDRFHVIALLNNAIDEIRRSQQEKCDRIGLKAIKGSRFLLLSNYEKLNPKKQTSLNCLLGINQPLALAHAMKEQIRLFWNKENSVEGARFLACWVMDTVDSGIKELNRAGKTLLRHGMDLLNYFKHRISNGKTEGINNKIKTMKRQAYGFRDMEYFKLRLYNLHKTRYSFV